MFLEVYWAQGRVLSPSWAERLAARARRRTQAQSSRDLLEGECYLHSMCFPGCLLLQELAEYFRSGYAFGAG